MSDDDIPWMRDLCARRYSDRFDHDGGINWFKNICLKSPLLFLPIRTDNAFCITMLSVLPWLPSEWEAHIVFIVADDTAHWEAIRLLRSSVEWARRRKAVRWCMVSETDVDLAPLARRVGAKDFSPRLIMRL